MLQTQSSKSYAVSAIEFNSRSLNPLASMSPTAISKVKRQAESYTNCAARCQNIWIALAKNDIAGSNLTQTVLENIFRDFQSDIYALTKIASLKDFMKIFDQDRDDSLNPDEQIRIFCFIKERLELVANNCLQIQSYAKFEQLMKEVRKLQANIAKWQDILRTRVHKNQLRKYRNEGQNRIDEFCDRFEKEYEDLQKVMLKRRQNFQKKVFYQAQNLQEKLSRPEQYLTIKPSNRIKELQMQEKLVSLEERVYEAMDFRRELNELQGRQKKRVDKLMMEHSQQSRQNLRKIHEKQRRQLELKLEEMENKLKIKMKNEFQILRKRNNLHEIEIYRLQALQKKWASKKGVQEPELKRTKKLKRERNEVLQEFKKNFSSNQQHQEPESLGRNRFNAKSLLKQALKFNISDQSDFDGKTDNNCSNKIHKYLTRSKNQKGYSLAKMYDNDLVAIQSENLMTQAAKQREKTRKFDFIMKKLQE